MRASRILIAISIATTVLFTIQRARSPFLAAEKDRAASEALARELVIPLADVQALHEGVGVDLGDQELGARAARWKALLAHHGAREAAARELCGDELLAVRFLSVAERFARRSDQTAR